MSNPFTNIKWKEVSKLKLFFIGLVALIGLAIVVSVLQMLMGHTGSYSGGRGTSFSAPIMVDKMAYESASPSTYSTKSINNAMGIASDGDSSRGYSTGGSAENYEAVSYNAQIKTRNIEQVCDNVESWKPLDYVVFENARRHDDWCRYRFKVEREHVNGVVTAVKALDPDEFSATTESMKKQLVRYDGQLSILLRKQDILESTLKDATNAYDQLVTLATRVEDVESLTKIINSKLGAIERLTKERVTLSQQIDSLARQSAELSDRVEYVYFSISVDRYVIFDISSIKDSWVYQVRSFVHDINETVQSLTIGLVSMLAKLLLTLTYVAIIGYVILFVLRYAWYFSKSFWKEGSANEQLDYSENNESQ